jgi:hypothetical protein
MKVSLARDVTLTSVEAGAVILDGRRGRYWQVNGSGAVVLQALLDGDTPAAIAARLSATAPVTREQVMADVSALVDALAAANLVQVSS